jgi:RNA polymerase sigma factor (sigma-70 family)
MANHKPRPVLQHLGKAALLRDGAGLTDGQLLKRFLTQRDDAAFAALVRRHGPMVWGVCRRVLSHHQDAEDAFQATFLVLVRKAAAVEPKELVANWLYGVAHQTALKARATAGKRKGRERQVAEMPEPAVEEQDLWRDLRPLLDQELSRLPDKYRVVIVLCDLQGKTRKEAAQQLGCPEGTVAGRLARARALLARRLARHGLAVSGGALAAVLSQKVASAGVPTAVVSSTIRAASLLAAGRAAVTGVISAEATALTEGVLKAMLLTKLRTATAILLTAGILALAVTVFAYHALAGEGADQRQTPDNQAGRPAEAAELKKLRIEIERLRKDIEELRKPSQPVRKGKAGDARLVTKVYPVSGLTSPELRGSDESGEGAEAKALIQVITRTVEPESWDVAGGKGTIEYLSPAASLVIRHTPDTHQQVQILLEALHKAKREQQKAEVGGV